MHAMPVQVRVGIALAICYIGMQTFAIPGSVSLSLVMGALYGRWIGFVLTALISTAGVTRAGAAHVSNDACTCSMG